MTEPDVELRRDEKPIKDLGQPGVFFEIGNVPSGDPDSDTVVLVIRDENGRGMAHFAVSPATALSLAQSLQREVEALIVGEVVDAPRMN